MGGYLYTDIAHPGASIRTMTAPRVPCNMVAHSVDPVDDDRRPINRLLAGGNGGIYEIHFAPDDNQNGIPDAVENALVPGSSTPTASAVLGTSNATTSAPIHLSAPTTSGDYVQVQVDLAAAHTGTCGFVSDLQIMGTDIVPAWNSKLTAAPTIRFILPDCQAAHVKITYSALTSYPLPVLGS